MFRVVEAARKAIGRRLGYRIRVFEPDGLAGQGDVSGDGLRVERKGHIQELADVFVAFLGDGEAQDRFSALGGVQDVEGPGIGVGQLSRGSDDGALQGAQVAFGRERAGNVEQIAQLDFQSLGVLDAGRAPQCRFESHVGDRRVDDRHDARAVADRR